MGSDATALRRALSDPHHLVRALGLDRGAQRQAGGVIARCPAHEERTPSCSIRVGDDGTIACRCHGCGWTGDALSLIGAVRELHDFRDILREAASIAGARIEDLDYVPQPSPSPRDYPSIESVEALWRVCAPPTNGAAQYLESRAIEAGRVEGLARVIARTTPLPVWASYRGRSWYETGHRLIVPAYDERGVMRSVRAWRTVDADTPKRLPPGGHRAAGLVLANARGVAMLRDRSIDGPLVIVEGEPDFLATCTRVDVAVLGIVSGAWSDTIATRVPDGYEVVIATHGDDAGDRYAAAIFESLRRECRRVVLGDRDLNDRAMDGEDIGSLLGLSQPEPTPAEIPVLHRGDHTEIADYWLSRVDRRHRTWDEGSYYHYEKREGVWRETRSEEVGSSIMSLSGIRKYSGKKGETTAVPFNAGTVEGVRSLIRERIRGDSFARFSDAPPGIAFRNGFVTVRDGRISIEKHAPEHLSRFALPYDYDANADCTAFNEFGDAVFADCSEEERAARLMGLAEYTGAMLIGEATRYEKALILFGSGGNGKGQMLSLIRALFPPLSVCSLPPQHWGQRFALNRLVGKLANLCDEIPKTDIADSAVWKAIISGNPQFCDVKNQPAIEFTPRAGHVFNENMHVGTSDTTHAFFRRFLFCPFTLDMMRTPTSRPDVWRSIHASCAAGIAAWAIEGAARAQRQGRITESEQGTTLYEEWRSEVDPPLRFARSRGHRAGERVVAAVLYEQFRSWCRDEGHAKWAEVSAAKFGRLLIATRLYTTGHGHDNRFYERV